VSDLNGRVPPRLLLDGIRAGPLPGRGLRQVGVVGHQRGRGGGVDRAPLPISIRLTPSQCSRTSSPSSTMRCSVSCRPSAPDSSCAMAARRSSTSSSVLRSSTTRPPRPLVESRWVTPSTAGWLPGGSPQRTTKRADDEAIDPAGVDLWHPDSWRGAVLTNPAQQRDGDCNATTSGARGWCTSRGRRLCRHPLEQQQRGRRWGRPASIRGRARR
jgi:hypothetical protein